MFRVQVWLLFFSTIMLISVGRHFDVVLVCTSLSNIAILLGPTSQDRIDPSLAYARSVTLLCIYAMNDLVSWFSWEAFTYFYNLSFGSLSGLIYLTDAVASTLLVIVFAVVYSRLDGGSKLLVPYFALTLIGIAPAVLLADVALDHAPQSTSFATIVGKEVVLGGRSLRHELQLDASLAGKVTIFKQLVALSLWDRTHVGDRICFHDHHGALNVTWKETDVCH